MCIELGYPDPVAERALLAGEDRRAMIADMVPVLDGSGFREWQHAAARVHISGALLDYIQALVAYTRVSPHFRSGLSPRAALALVHCARSWAFLEGRDMVLPEDVQAVLPEVAVHRLKPAGEKSMGRQFLVEALMSVPLP